MTKAAFTIDRISKWRKQTQVRERFRQFNPVYRFVFDEGEEPEDYDGYVQELASQGMVMGCVIDSYYIKDFTVDQCVDRFLRYHDRFHEHVAYWEVWNEVGGGSNDPLHLQKGLAVARKLMERGRALLAINGYLQAGYLDFLSAIPEDVRNMMTLAMLSVYPQDNGGLSQVNWTEFTKLFPSAQCGVGECGSTSSANALSTFDYFYKNMAQGMAGTPRVAGLFFWWYFFRDFVDASPRKNLTDHAIDVISGWK